MADKVKFEIFRGPFVSWNTLFQRAADFATSIGRDRLIGISHSSDDVDGVVTVWYWDDTRSRVLNLEETA